MPHPRRRGTLPATWLAAAAIAAVAVPALAANPPSHPAWPNNGIAQRRFPDAGLMFVENDHGTLHAWVLQGVTGPKVHVLDFFSGRQLEAKAQLEDDGSQDRGFTGPDGRFHDAEDQGFQHSGPASPIALPGLDFDGDIVSLKGTISGCFVQLKATTGQAGTPGRFLIHHAMGGPKGCPGGRLDSSVTGALDLDDGTFLAVEDCFVFRLRRSDLSPAGSAPALRAIDQKHVEAVFDAAATHPVPDATAFLAKALDVPTSPDLSCR